MMYKSSGILNLGYKLKITCKSFWNTRTLITSRSKILVQVCPSDPQWRLARLSQNRQIDTLSLKGERESASCQYTFMSTDISANSSPAPKPAGLQLAFRLAGYCFAVSRKKKKEMERKGCSARSGGGGINNIISPNQDMLHGPHAHAF